MLLAAVGVAAVHHQRGWQFGFDQILAGGFHALRVVVGCFAATQNDVAVRVALGLHDRDLAVFVHRQKVVTASGSLDRIGGNLDVAIGAVFKADGRRNAGGQFAVHLALGGTRADGAPGNQIPQVLRRNHVQKLAACGQSQAVDVNEQLARDAQAFINAKALVQVGVVDQAFPADGGAWFFEVHAHHDFQRVGVVGAHLLQTVRIVQRSGGVMDGARPNDDQQAVVLASHDGLDALAGGRHQGLHCRAADGEKADQVLGGR